MYSLPKLPYSPKALEPAIDEATMKLHHDKHHQTYVDNLNKALEGHEDLQKMHGADLLMNLDKVPKEIQMKVRNNLGGVMNHNMFWQVMSPPNAKYKILNTKLGSEIKKTFGSLEDFQEKFSAVGLACFGSGWVWLLTDEKGNLSILDTPNQDNPLMPEYLNTNSQPLTPILCLDVWEHAYYLKYQNRRAEYIKNWWNVVNWQEVESRYQEATP